MEQVVRLCYQHQVFAEPITPAHVPNRVAAIRAHTHAALTMPASRPFRTAVVQVPQEQQALRAPQVRLEAQVLMAPQASEVLLLLRHASSFPLCITHPSGIPSAPWR